MIRPQSVGHGLDVSIPSAILPSAQSFTASNVETRVGEANTPGLFYSYAIDDHWGIEVFGGIPPEVELYGKGVVNALITGNPDATTVSIEGEADPFFSAVGTLGVDVSLTEKFGLKASATYVPSSTDVRLKIKDSKGKKIGQASSTIPIDPLIFFVAVSYRFNP